MANSNGNNANCELSQNVAVVCASVSVCVLYTDCPLTQNADIGVTGVTEVRESICALNKAVSLNVWSVGLQRKWERPTNRGLMISFYLINC